MTALLLFAIILAFLVVAHELGHYVVARLRGVQVLEFGVGLPPRVFGIERGGTVYSLNLLPLGGFVRMLGEDEATMPKDPRAFSKKGPYSRLAILGAGAGVNALLPILLLTAVLALPHQVATSDVVIAEVVEGAPAHAAGVRAGDIVRVADGREVDRSSVLQEAIHLRLGADSTWEVERGSERFNVMLQPRIAPPPGQGATGIRIVNARVSVADVAPGSAAARSGLRAGDSLLLLRSESVLAQRLHQVLTEAGAEEALAAALSDVPGAGAQAVILRDGAIVTLPLADARALSGAALLERPTESRSQPLWVAFPNAFRELGDIMFAFRNEISRILAGASRLEVAGPVGIAQITGEVADAGLGPLITWTALLSINLAIFNLLPLPALDGGRMALVLLELARGGKRLAPERERLLHVLGFAMLMAVAVMISINDIRRLLSGGSLLGG